MKHWGFTYNEDVDVNTTPTTNCIQETQLKQSGAMDVQRKAEFHLSHNPHQTLLYQTSPLPYRHINL